METSGAGFSSTRRILEELQQEISGIGYVYRGYLASLVIGFVFAVIVAAAVLSASSVTGAVSATFAVSGVSALVSAVVVVPLLYKGFRILAARNMDYSIGVKGAMVLGAGDIVLGITLIILASTMPSGTRNPEKLASIITGDLIIIIGVGLIAFIGNIMLLIALWRLGGAHPEHGGDVVKTGLVLWIIGAFLRLLQVRLGGLLSLIGDLVILYGLYRMITGLENVLSEKEYELSRRGENP